ncbi:ribonuclease H domain-containing protein [Tanacetum coccineum]
MSKMNDNVNMLMHDQVFARQVMDVPDNEWRETGDWFEKPYGKGVESGSGEEVFRVYCKGICKWFTVNGEESLKVKSVIGSLGLRRVRVFCDSNAVYGYLTGKGRPTNNTTVTLVTHLETIQRKLLIVVNTCEAYIIKVLLINWQEMQSLLSEVKEYTATSSAAGQGTGMRKCVKCRRLFCVNCKVPWHDKFTCSDYKRFYPSRSANVAISFATRVELSGLTRKQLATVQFGMSATLDGGGYGFLHLEMECEIKVGVCGDGGVLRGCSDWDTLAELTARLIREEVRTLMVLYSEGRNIGVKPKEGGSILKILDEMIKVGQTMGFSMEGCTKDMENIIGSKGVYEILR